MYCFRHIFRILPLQLYVLMITKFSSGMAANYDTASVQSVLDVTPHIGEGPHWEHATGRLLFVDIEGGKLYRWHPASGELETREFEDTTTSFIIPHEKGGYVISQGRRIVALNWDTKDVTTLAEIEEIEGVDNRLNDGKCDPSGRLWTGSMAPYDPEAGLTDSGLGVLGRLDTEGIWREYLDGIDVSNGLAWTIDTRTMFYIDSIVKKVYAFDFDNENGTISNQRVFVDFTSDPLETPGYPDGCCIDTNDNLWVASWNSSRVFHFNTTTGAKLGEIVFPTENITSCCFGGPTYEDLYVTSAALVPTDDQPQAGNVFKVTGLGVRGLPGVVYKGVKGVSSSADGCSTKIAAFVGVILTAFYL